jgi:penicillin amidase
MPRELAHRVPPPAPRDAALTRRADALVAAVPPPADVPRGMVLGSNNWAVAASRTAGAGALLAGDPHLNLTLPSIWYEVHLVVPGELDVHGVTIPGVPGVIIGFTPRVAWSVTNNYADVVDFYEEQLDDADRPTAYRLDGEWVPLEVREERYLGRDGAVIAEDTLYFTHRGPLRRTGAGDLSMRWLALEEGASPSLFVRAAQAVDVEALMSTVAAYTAPAQNFAMADAQGRIAILSAGLYPIRPPPAASGAEGAAPAGDGRRIRDGTTRASDWSGFWPLSRYPQALDPAQGYVASANQQPVDPMDEPAYLGSNWTSPWRALRINELLRADDAVTAQDMAAWQTDPGNAKAARIAPAFVAAAAGDAALSAPRALLAAWDHRYLADAEAPLLFEAAFERLEALLWDELEFDAAEAAGLPTPPRPREVVVLSLLDDPDSAWWDDASTALREDRDALLRRALADAWASLTAAHGEAGDGAWAWARHRRANIEHLARFPGLGRFDLTVSGGGPGNLNPSSGRGTHGASWRMVVALDPRRGVHGQGVYPGGQSGNPAHPGYDRRLAAWQRGALEPMPSPPSAAEALEAAGSVRLRLVRRAGG